ncbi:MAG: C39 family peptidase [Eubacterium sp.]|nr:C39 family peptidase [Eubacterium sp.]
MRKIFALSIFIFAFFTCIVLAGDYPYNIDNLTVGKCSSCVFADSTEAAPVITKEVTKLTSLEAAAEIRKTEHIIENFPIVIQTPELPTGCEITAATMMMNYYGFNVGKVTMANEYLPKTNSKNLHYHDDGKLYGSNLNSFFIGNPREKSGYVCGTQAIVKAVNDYIETNSESGMRAIDITGTYAKTLYDFVADNIPVTVWITIDMANRHTTEGWYTEDSVYVDWSTNDHCAVLIGYNENSVTIVDPLTGIVEYSRERFENVYISRGSKCVIIENFS